MRRVAITGLGVLSACGNDAPSFWHAMTAGRSGIGPITAVPLDKLSVKVAAEIKGYDPADHFDRGRLALLDRVSQIGLIAAGEALRTSGVEIDEALGARTATILGSGAPGQETLDDNYFRIYAQGGKRTHPFAVPRLMANAVVSQITMEYGLTGPAFLTASACSSAGHAIGLAFHMVRAGTVDLAITGGAEACLTFGTLKAWEALRVMAPDTCRPFSRQRKGMVLGEGAAVFVLEPLDAARRRGAPILAEIVGFGMTADAGDIVQPSLAGGARAIAHALNDASLPADAVDYVNAHGTGTAANDVTESRALRQVFGAAADRIAVSSTKSMHGHTLGAAAAVELAATVLALRDQVVPPTANYLDPDPDCDLDYVPNDARSMPLRAALCNSFAFGGLNAVLAVRRFEG